jgi:glycosyltransferase involved in cell wall biosynthesis
MKPVTQQRPAVCFLSGCKAGTTYEYRVLQKQEQLSIYDIQSIARQDLAHHQEVLEEALSYDILYLYRLAYSPILERLILQARARNIPIIFGTDDLVFEPELVQEVDPVKAMPNEEAALYYEGIWRYRQTLLASDYVVTATEYLADLARTLGKPTFVHRNGVSQWMIDESKILLDQGNEKSERDTVVIGYGSGTDTHRKDLAEIAEALSEILERHPNVELHIVGLIALPDNLVRFESRIKRHSLVGWHEWLSVLHTFDINLAPLESGNPFCKAKSEIKYTEAAILSIPTVASCIGAYEFAIRDGETGFLASSTDEWIAKLERLLIKPSLRHRIGEAARADVLERYTPTVLGQELVQTLNDIREHYARQKASMLELDSPSKKTPLILNWIFPEPIPGSGGHMDIIRMMNLLTDLGHQVNAYVVPRQRLWNKSDLEIRDFIRSHFNDLDGGVFKWNGGSMHESDAVVATHWTTAYMIDEVDNASKKFYFVQDWEPFFFPMGTQYLRAEQTYKMGLSCITLGAWLTRRLREWYEADADYFDLAVDHSIYHPRTVEKPKNPRICFYARPSTPRRLFPIGIKALSLINHHRPDVEIVLYGVKDTELHRHQLPFPHTNLGILSEQELAELFSSSDVGIVLSSTNCSLIPPEMMACRCAVVDLNRETVKGVLEHEVNALLSESTPEAIADAVLRLLVDDALRQRLIETAYQQVQERSWEKSAQRVEEILYQKLPPLRRALNQHRFDVQPSLPALAELPQDQQVRLNAIHGERQRIKARWLARVKGWAKRLLQAEQGLTLSRKPVQTLGELTGKRRIGQSFVARRDGLHRIDVLVGTYGRRNTRDLILHLKESPTAGYDLATVRINACLLPDNHYAHFIFDPQPESRDKSYYFYLESPNSVPGDAVTLWAYGDVDLADARLYQNGRFCDGQLIFGLFYMDDRVGEVGERPLLRQWGRPKTLWQQLEKAYRVFTTQGAQGLWQEVVNYWKWKTGRV